MDDFLDLNLNPEKYAYEKYPIFVNVDNRRQKFRNDSQRGNVYPQDFTG